MTDEERLAAEARRLLDDPILKGAFAALEARATEQLLSLPTTPECDRQRCALVDRINAVRQLREELRLLIIKGEQATRIKPSFA